MADGMMNRMQFHMVAMWAVLLLVGLVFLGMVMFFLSRAPAHGLSTADLARGQRGLALPIQANPEVNDQSAHDTIFILPDISHYTKFMAGNRFAFAHAQHIIFSLINSMIEAGTRTLELSKLEGDAVLFYVDASKHSEAVIGQCVLDIFSAFFWERERLRSSNLCLCRACRHVEDLDLKVFVHRGQATRFTFRGSVDHFGTDVIILHRIMKNGVSGDRYVMVTEDAMERVRLPLDVEPFEIEERVEHVGTVRGRVFEISDEAAAKLCEVAPAETPYAMAETYYKLRANLRSVTGAFRG